MLQAIIGQIVNSEIHLKNCSLIILVTLSLLSKGDHVRIGLLKLMAGYAWPKP